MKEIVSILIIAISLSMDTFSLSISLGSIIQDKNNRLFPLLVSIFHFLLPIIGNKLGTLLNYYLNVDYSKILGIILIILAINVFVNYFKNNEIDIKLNLLSFIILAFSVSIDSFTVGIGLQALTRNILSSSLIFSIFSGLFTYCGIIIGRYTNKLLGKKANIVAIAILLVVAIINLF